MPHLWGAQGSRAEPLVVHHSGGLLASRTGAYPTLVWQCLPELLRDVGHERVQQAQHLQGVQGGARL